MNARSEIIKRALALAVCAALVLLAGCADAGETPGTAPAPDAASPSPQASAGPAPSEPPGGDDGPAVPARPGILDAGIGLDDAGAVSRIPNGAVEEALMQSLFAFGDELLTSHSAYDAGAGQSVLVLRVISLDTGEVLHTASLAGLSVPSVQVCGDRVAVADFGTGEIAVFDSGLRESASYSLAPGAVYLNKAAAVAYRVTPSDGIAVTELASGRESVLLENSRGLYASAYSGGAVSMSYVDTATGFSAYAALDLETGELLQLPADASLAGVEYADGFWLAGVMGGDGEYIFERSYRLQSFTPDGGALPALVADGHARLMLGSLSAEGELTMRLYAEGGAFLTSCTVRDAASVPSSLVWSRAANGYFFTLIGTDGVERLHFLDLGRPAQGADLALEPWEDGRGPDAGTAVGAELYERAARLSESFDVTVRIADQCGTGFGDKAVKPETDEKYISAALDTLERALSAFPEGFFSQLYHTAFRELEINLMGPIASAEPAAASGDGISFTSFLGFVADGSAEYVMVLDIRQYSTLERTIYHEISHVIDRFLAHDAYFRENALFSEDGWAALNPDGFSYAGRLWGIPLSVYTDGFDAYFIDIYSRTFPSEDRARIIEHAMLGDTAAFEGLSGRAAKLEYYCRCIRDAFDTADWPEATRWEQTLEAVSGR